MRALALLADPSFQKVATIVGKRDRIDRASNEKDVIAVLQQIAYDVVVIDPALIRDAHLEEVLNTIRRSHAGLLCYAEPTIRSTRCILAAAERGIGDVVLRGTNDAPVLLARRLHGARQPSAAPVLLHRLADRITALPEPIALAILMMMFGVGVPATVMDFARSASTPRRTLDRWMKRARFRSAASLLSAARLVRVWGALFEQDETATRAPLSGDDRFWRRTKYGFSTVVGLQPREAVKLLSPARFVEHVVRYVIDGHDEDGTQSGGKPASTSRRRTKAS